MTDRTSGGLAPDPFDPAALRLDQAFAETAGVKRLLTTVPVRKPNRQDFVRVHPDPRYQLTPASIIELKEDRETYLARPVRRVPQPHQRAAYPQAAPACSGRWPTSA